ncbi:metallophosphoesterase [bacterium]|nr:metallophosphoesterase [bacterium]
MAYSLRKANKIKKHALQHGVKDTASKFGISVDSVRRAIRLADAGKKESSMYYYNFETGQSDKWHEGMNTTCWPYVTNLTATEVVERLKASFSAGEYNGNKQEAYVPDIKPSLRSSGSNRILVIGDLHAPFDYDQYFNHCLSIYDKYDCNRVVFIGDVIDNHYSSYHETDADGMGGQEELDEAIYHLARWHEAFPVADITIGNHDRMVMRKAQTSNIPTRWIRQYKDVLGAPEWNFTDRVVYDGVQYIHGEGGTARARCKKDLMSTVQGHLHTQAYTEWVIGAGCKVFGMQVGCGIDHESYAMGYARNFGKPAIGCGVVLSGKVAINEMMSTVGV